MPTLALASSEFLAACAGLLSAFLWGLGCLMFDRVQARPPAGVGARVAPPSAAGMNLYKNSLCCLVLLAVLVPGLLLGGGGEFALPSGGAFWLLAFTGVVGFAVGDSLYFAAFPKAGVRVTAMMGTLIPVLAGLMSWLFLDRVFPPMTWVWMAVVLGGISLVLLDPVGRPAGKDGEEAPARTRALGLLYALGSAVSQAVGIVLAFGAFEGVGVVPGTVARLAGGIVAALVIGAATGLLPRSRGVAAELAELTRPLRTPVLVRMLALPTLVATILSLPLHSAATRGAPPQISALVLACSPLFILPLGRFFGARHGAMSLVGTLIGLVGVAGVLQLTVSG